MFKNNRLVKNYLYNVSYQILTIIVPLITTPYISRVLGAENLGIYSFTTSIVSYFTLFIILGLHLYGEREVAYNQNDKETISIRFFEIQGFKLLTTTIVVFLYLLFILIYGKYKIILLLQLVTLLGNFFDISWFFQGLEEFRVTVLRNLIVKILGTILIFLLVNNEKQLWLYVLINVGIISVGNITLWAYLPQKINFINHEFIHVFRNIRQIFELFLPLIAVQVYYMLDKTMLGFINNGEMTQSGFYEQTTKIINLCMALVTSISTVILPRMSAEFAIGNFNKIKDTVTKAIRFVLLLSCPICFGIIAISESVIPWFFGEEFFPVSFLLKVYSWILLIVPVSNVIGNGILTPTGQHNKGTVAVTCGAISNMFLNLLLIKNYGALGATVATLIAEMVVLSIHLYYARDYLDLKSILKTELRYMIASTIMCGLIVLLDNYIVSLFFSGIIRTMILTTVGCFIYLFLVLIVGRDTFLNNLIRSIIHNKGDVL